MSKKIIYLLSLLMALSLVFASCKKNPVGVQGGNPNQEDNTIEQETGGLQKTWDDIKDKTIMNNYAVIGESGGDYYRNPVTVALGGGNILIVAEKRVNFKGSENDIGVNGEKPVDMVYLLSSDAGDNFSSPAIIGGTASTGGKDAVSAPVVYYKQDNNNNQGNKVYIIASAGAGISRVDQNYSERTTKSSLKYAVGTVSGTSGAATIDWGTGWKDLDVKALSPETVQFGTHSGRGVFADDSNLILPVITAEQGKNGAAKEMMGVTFYKVNAAGELTLGEKIGSAVNFEGGSASGFSVFKEARPVAYDSTGNKVTYLVVPSPSNGKTKMGKGEVSASSSAQPIETQITGSEGSFGFLELKDSWYGTGEYSPEKYATTPGTAGGAQGTGAGGAVKLFSHVKTQTGENHLYMLNDGYTATTGKSVQLAKTGKSSSIDVLPDGTVIIVAEKEKNPNAAGNKFNIFFSRYTQKYLAEQLQ